MDKPREPLKGQVGGESKSLQTAAKAPDSLGPMNKKPETTNSGDLKMVAHPTDAELQGNGHGYPHPDDADDLKAQAIRERATEWREQVVARITRKAAQAARAAQRAVVPK